VQKEVQGREGTVPQLGDFSFGGPQLNESSEIDDGWTLKTPTYFHTDEERDSSDVKINISPKRCRLA
jgi:hypothetical protein